MRLGLKYRELLVHELMQEFPHVSFDRRSWRVVLMGKHIGDIGDRALAIAEFPESATYLIERKILTVTRAEQYELIVYSLAENVWSSTYAVDGGDRSRHRLCAFLCGVLRLA
jgi:hypothetical protein